MSKAWWFVFVLFLVIAISGVASARHHQQHHDSNVRPSDIGLPDSDNIMSKYGPIIPGHNPVELSEIIEEAGPALHDDLSEIDLDPILLGPAAEPASFQDLLDIRTGPLAGGCPPFCLKSPDLRDDYFFHIIPYLEAAPEILAGSHSQEYDDSNMIFVDPYYIEAVLTDGLPYVGVEPWVQYGLSEAAPAIREPRWIVDWDQGLSDWHAGTIPPFEFPVMSPQESLEISNSEPLVGAAK